MYQSKGIANSRIEVADALRGLAVAGIILYHSVEHFNLGYADVVTHTLPCDGTMFNVLTVLFSGKMYGIFALLFGLSFFIMRDNQAQKGKDFSARFFWRMVLLLGFGILNLVFYNGDILTFYALLGLLMIPAGYLSTPVLWAVTIFLLAQPIEIYSLLSGWKPDLSALGGYYQKMGPALEEGSFWEAAAASLRYGFRCSWLWFLAHGRITQTVVLLWYGFAGFRRSLTHICFFGRMSLTNYLLSSLIGSFLFYGWGLGLYRELGVTWSFLVGLAIVTLQILLLRLWSRHHPRGPLETLWRKLTWIQFRPQKTER